jgi:putative transposase
MSNPRIFRDFKSSPEIIHLAVMMYVRYPLSLRNVEDLRFKVRRTAVLAEWRQICPA